MSARFKWFSATQNGHDFAVCARTRDGLVVGRIPVAATEGEFYVWSSTVSVSGSYVTFEFAQKAVERANTPIPWRWFL